MGKKLSAYNLYMRKALKGKMAGKTKAQRKAIFKAAARGWNKGKPRSTSRSKPKSASSRRSSSTPRRVNRMGTNTFNTQKLFSLLRKASLIAPAAGVVMSSASPQTKVVQGIELYTGYNIETGMFHFEALKRGWTPYVVTSLVTHGIPKLIGLMKGLF